MEVQYVDKTLIKSFVKPRSDQTNKGDFGTLCMLCGSEMMTGAAYLAAQGALRSGVGLLKALGDNNTLNKLQQILYEPVFADISTFNFEKCSAFLCGCGIGRQYDFLLSNLISNCSVNAVFDADCINFIAAHMDVLSKAKCNITLTPHPGEMSRLTGKSIEDIQSDRINTAADFAKKYGCVTVLKGNGTVIASPDGSVFVNTTGSSALAKGGSGDVLAGVIASLNAQGYNSVEAAVTGVYTHGKAGDILAEKYGKSGVIPSDLPKVIGSLLG